MERHSFSSVIGTKKPLLTSKIDNSSTTEKHLAKSLLKGAFNEAPSLVFDDRLV
jgi:hypothetical protein